jgi:hypothetical protein
MYSQINNYKLRKKSILVSFTEYYIFIFITSHFEFFHNSFGICKIVKKTTALQTWNSRKYSTF